MSYLTPDASLIRSRVRCLLDRVGFLLFALLAVFFAACSFDNLGRRISTTDLPYKGIEIH